MDEKTQADRASAAKGWLDSPVWALLLGGALMCWGLSLFPARVFSYLFYYLDCRYWPKWYSINLWTAAVTVLIAMFIRRRKVRRVLYTVGAAVIAAVTCFFSVWVHALFRWARGAGFFLYDRLIVRYVSGPVSDLFSEGTVSWRLLTLPVLFLLAAGAGVFYCRRKKGTGLKRAEKEAEKGGSR